AVSDAAFVAPPRVEVVRASPPSPSSLAPHLPHTGCLPTTVTRSSTRFFAPHFAHVRIATASTSSLENSAHPDSLKLRRPGFLLRASVTQLRARVKALRERRTPGESRATCD